MLGLLVENGSHKLAGNIHMGLETLQVPSLDVAINQHHTRVRLKGDSHKRSSIVDLEMPWKTSTGWEDLRELEAAALGVDAKGAERVGRDLSGIGRVEVGEGE